MCIRDSLCIHCNAKTLGFQSKTKCFSIILTRKLALQKGPIQRILEALECLMCNCQSDVLQNVLQILMEPVRLLVVERMNTQLTRFAPYIFLDN